MKALLTQCDGPQLIVLIEVFRSAGAARKLLLLAAPWPFDCVQSSRALSQRETGGWEDGGRSLGSNVLMKVCLPAGEALDAAAGRRRRGHGPPRHQRQIPGLHCYLS